MNIQRGKHIMEFKCTNCGTVLDGQPERCPKCGKRMIYPGQELPVKKEEVKQEEAPTPKERTDSLEIERSYFDGGLLQKIGWTLLGALITLITIGICFPWAVCMIYNWETKHTVIEGRRLGFNGHAVQLVGNWLLWILLTIITVGIFALWIPIKIKKWVTKHTYFQN